MKVKVIAPFEIHGRDADDFLELEQGASVREVLKRSKWMPGLSRVMPVMVNGEPVKHTYILKDGDVLVIVFPFSGG
jgi:molybdopterin converting factor small subunit